MPQNEAAQAMLSRVYLYMSGTYENPKPGICPTGS